MGLGRVGWVVVSFGEGLGDGTHVAFERENEQEREGNGGLGDREIVTSKSCFVSIWCLTQIDSALIIDDSTFTKDSTNPKTNKGKARPPLPFIRFHGPMSNEATLIHACVFGVFCKGASQSVCTSRDLGLTEISDAQGVDHLPSAHTW
ncbi:hypothetical protein DVH24_024067 [Malus domestica]|uniref:Uncharacterized protein n=1 Tax=Malus domestica TaxID=3750 RepID=A0A498JKR1_MALDO|nr:hypothetical protein DVH24_024067 [Malus domestica]